MASMEMPNDKGPLTSIELTVVIPAYNEEMRLPKTLPLVISFLDENFTSYEVIVVDDGSSDSTSEVVQKIFGDNPHLVLISYNINQGKGYAVRKGVLAARGKYVLISDADLSTPIEEVWKLLAPLRSGTCDVAIGSRALRDSKIVKYQPIYRMLMGKIFNKFVCLLAVRGIVDTQCGFKCFNSKWGREIFSRSRISGFGFDVEALFVARRLGLAVQEIGVSWCNDPLSKVHPIYHSLQMLRDLMRVRWYGFIGSYK